MYREHEVLFCRACGAKWTSGASACHACGETLDGAPGGRRVDYRAQPTRTRLVRAGAAVSGLTALVSALFGLSAFFLRDDTTPNGELTQEASDAATIWLLSVSLSEVLVFVTSLVFFTWLFDAGRNLRALGRMSMRFTEENRIAWCFVPIARMVMPFLGLIELNQASRGGQGRAWQEAKAHRATYLWWGAWLVHNLCFKVVVAYIFLFEAETQSPAEGLVLFATMTLCYLALALASAAMYVVVGDTQAHQSA